MQKLSRSRKTKKRQRQTRKLYRQRGGAIVGLLPAIVKMTFIMSLYRDNPSITVFLNRVLKVMETATRIIPKTLPELEDYIVMNGYFVPGDPGDPARKDALRAKMLTRELLRIPHAGRDDYGIMIHNDHNNLFGFEQNINNIIITTTQLFDTLVKTVDAAGVVNDPGSRRQAFLATFDHMQWICVDGSVTEILEFIANSAFIIDPKQSFLLNFMRRINLYLNIVIII